MDVVVEKYLDSVNEIKQSGLKMVDKSTWNHRLSVCKLCNYYESYDNQHEVFKCTKCGCPGFNFMLKNTICPLKPSKWK